MFVPVEYRRRFFVPKGFFFLVAFSGMCLFDRSPIVAQETLETQRIDRRTIDQADAGANDISNLEETATEEGTRAAETTVNGRVVAVTVYPNFARVRKTLEIPGTDEPLQYVRVRLPRKVVASSVFVESSADVDVRSVEVNRAAIDLVKIARRKELLDRSVEIQRQSDRLLHDLEVIDADLVALGKMVDFSSLEIGGDLRESTLDIKTVIELNKYSSIQRAELADKAYEVKRELESLDASEQKIAIALETLTEDVANRDYVAKVTVSTLDGAAKAANVEVRYEVQDCNWTQKYKLRGFSDSNDFQLVSSAVLFQNTGETWGNAEITLATANPTAISSGPGLSPLPIDALSVELSDQPSNMRGGMGGMGGGMGGMGGGMGGWNSGAWTEEEIAVSMSPDESSSVYSSIDEVTEAKTQRNVELNRNSALRQLDELRDSSRTDRVIASDALQTASAEIVLSNRYTVVSQPASQRLQIFDVRLPGEIDLRVVPMLTSYAYRAGTLVNTTDRTLLAGLADVYWNGNFVGSAAIASVEPKQKLFIGFGQDRTLRARRELISRTVEPRGANRLISLKYRLVMINTSGKDLACQLYDRLPIHRSGQDIQVRLPETVREALSKDEMYVRLDQSQGILCWDVSVPPRHADEELLDVEYEYQVELAKDQDIASSEIMQTISADQQFQNVKGGMGGGGMGGIGWGNLLGSEPFAKRDIHN
jgi:hypothetical protein